MTNKISTIFIIVLLSLVVFFQQPLLLAKENNSSLGSYKKNHFNLYSINDDIKLGTQVQQEQIKEFKKKKIPVDPPSQAQLKSRIEKIVSRLAKVSDRPNLPYEVHIYDKKDIVNAFCLPGGKIGIFTGLFDKDKGLVDPNSDDQIAAVLGHEMAHATLRHITRRLGTMQGLGIVGSIASVALGEGVGLDARKFFDQVYAFGVNLYFPSYSRKHEREADRAGFYYLAKAGYKPQAAIAIWEKAASRGGRNATKTDFFASHPADGERANTLKGWLTEAKTISESRQK